MHGLTYLDLIDRPAVIDKETIERQLKSVIDECFGDQPLPKLLTQNGRVRLSMLMASTLQSEYGAWVCKWQHSTSDGGYVNSWCCSSHSVLVGDNPTVEKTIGRVADAVIEWHQRIAQLEKRFESLGRELKELPIREHVERASVVLVDETIQMNSGTEAWFWAFIELMYWYFESVDICFQSIEQEIELAVEGHFESWVAPPSKDVEQCARQLGSIVSEQYSPQAEPLAAVTDTRVDSTAIWLRSRPQGSDGTAPGVQSFKADRDVSVDVHRQFIHEFDFKRSHSRGAAMELALEQCRRDAKETERLDWQMLCHWQSLVLGKAVDFRTTDAFAKQGRERYPITPGTPKQFKKLLMEANHDACPILLAARVFNDICYFHPFEDGNARSARLALEFVLTRNDLALILADPIFRLSRPVYSYQMSTTLACLVGRRCFT